MRLIDADELKKIVDVRRTIEAIDNAPTVDAVEVVRCRDCVYWKHRAKRNGYEWGACLFIEELEDAEHWTEDADFCSYGERSEE